MRNILLAQGYGEMLGAGSLDLWQQAHIVLGEMRRSSKLLVRRVSCSSLSTRTITSEVAGENDDKDERAGMRRRLMSIIRNVL